MIEQVDREGVEAIAAQMVPKLLGATTQRDRPDLVKQVRNLIVANTPDGVKAAVTAMMDRSDSTPLLAKIDVPTLIVHGAEDTLIPPSRGRGHASRDPELAARADAVVRPSSQPRAAGAVRRDALASS